ncbi:phosphoenolpyruvate synthase, partial [Spongiibacter marinus]|uniref:phosphoenolpyruvate synthase n=1 Tax=Spongiibacter marinus TaxID=354246 RepID=UPI004046AB91
DRQLDSVTLDRVFTDKASGKDVNRPQLEAMLSFIREGDTVVVHSMDRLARNLDDLRRLVQSLTNRGVRIEFVKESLAFTGEDSPMANLMLSVMGAFAEFERALIRERQREGIAVAKQRGAYRGRKRSLSDEMIAELHRRAAAGERKAAIARELGIPAVVGCGDATERLSSGQDVTVSCAEGDTGMVYAGQLDFDISRNKLDAMPELPFKIMMNVGNPDRAFDFQAYPNAGVGLARLEFIINRMIGVHPKALINYDTLPRDVQQAVKRRVAGYADPVEFYVEKLVEGISSIASAFYPERVIVRMSDFKSNEYAHLIGGSLYEPSEENPMLGFRGASRYISDSFRECFELECRALKKVREEMDLQNVEIMVPFVRTVGEAKQVVELLADNGLKRGENGLKVIMMCELPANALLAEQFLEHFDGFSIGSNDLTQLTLGLDRDSGLIAHLFDERNEAVKVLLSNAIRACKEQGKYIGICGQGPSDHPDFAQWLMEQGIDSVSLNPDSVLETWLFLADKLK